MANSGWLYFAWEVAQPQNDGQSGRLRPPPLRLSG